MKFIPFLAIVDNAVTPWSELSNESEQAHRIFNSSVSVSSI